MESCEIAPSPCSTTGTITLSGDISSQNYDVRFEEFGRVDKLAKALVQSMDIRDEVNRCAIS